MSCDWDIRCLDCGVSHGFEDANNRDDLMLLLIEHAVAIAALVPLLADPCADIALTGDYRHRINASWFAKHATHRLRPIDEYGVLLGQCRKRVACCACGSAPHCVLAYEHAGACTPGPTAP